ncbi:DUF134 domain-containing protein [Desulfurivibrio sp. D14AmB]|uniref:DUF134 domain-containing protein n=1 Tax=Desulfurivibrio sp. D14AmB TaxID=3374370 RepID=UPI00376F111C
MPRPKKQRHCQLKLCGQAFKPTGKPLRELRQIVLQRDELEVLKLCDLEGLFQEQAGERMGVSRGTVQRILTNARRKVTEALVEGAALVFEGEESPPESAPPTESEGALPGEDQLT